MGARWFLRFLGPKLELPRSSAYSPYLRCLWSSQTAPPGGLWHQASGDHPPSTTVDTRQNTRLPIFVSPISDVAAMAIDAMSLNWREMWGYAYPPHTLLPLILRKIPLSPWKIILVAPLWPAARWFVQLLLLLVSSNTTTITRPTHTGRDPPQGSFHPKATRV